MSHPRQDRNLLIGVIALQMDLIDRDQLIKAMQDWVLDKTTSIESVLVKQGALSESRCGFLTGIADKHLELHDNEVEKSLAELSSLGSVRNDLMDLEDSQMTQSLNSASELRNTAAENTLLGDVSADFSMGEAVEGGRFRVLRPHAQGGLGVVSIAEDRELHRQVALKQIKPTMVKDAVSRSRFMVEAEVTGRLEHPGIVPVYSLGTTADGSPYYAMRFIQGDSLKENIRRFHRAEQSDRSSSERALQLRSLVQRLVDVCDAMEYAHSRGVLHRDLKPGNIMLGKYGETLVVDWGLARVQGKDYDGLYEEDTLLPASGESSADTRMGTALGTVAFMSPEQAAGNLSELGPRSDVYSLGATLYAILTGKPAIDGSNPTEGLRRVKEGDYPSAKQLSSWADPALVAICDQAMSLKAGDRYESAAVFGKQLDLWLAGEPVQAYREPLLRRVGRVISRHQTAFAGFVTFCVVALLATGILQQMTARQNTELRKSRDQQRTIVYNTLNSVETGLQQGLTLQAAADQMFRKSVDELRSLHSEDPSNASVQQAFAESLRGLALQETKTGNAAAGAKLLKESLTLHSELVNSSEFAEQMAATQRSRIIRQLIDTSSDIVVALRQNNQYADARNAVGKTNELLQQFAADVVMSETSVLESRSRAQCTAAGIRMDFEEWEAARDLAAASHEGHEKLFQLYQEKRLRESANAQIYRFVCIEQLGGAQREIGELDLAFKVYEEGFQKLTEVQKANPNNVNLPYLRARMTDSYCQLVLKQSKGAATAIDQQIAAVAEFQSRVDAAPTQSGYVGFLGRCQCTLARLYAEDRQTETATKWFDQSIKTLRPLTEAAPYGGFSIMLADALRYRVLFDDQFKAESFDRAVDLKEALTAIRNAIKGSDSNRSMERLQNELTQL